MRNGELLYTISSVGFLSEKRKRGGGHGGTLCCSTIVQMRLALCTYGTRLVHPPKYNDPRSHSRGDHAYFGLRNERPREAEIGAVIDTPAFQLMLTWR